MPYVHPVILTFGLVANWFAHFVDMLGGREAWRPSKAILPLNIGLMVHRWGVLQGGLLSYCWMAVLGL